MKKAVSESSVETLPKHASDQSLETYFDANKYDISHPATDSEAPIDWETLEFVAHEKSPTWYITLLLITLVGTLLVGWLSRDIISTLTIIFAMVGFAFYSARKPRMQKFSLDGGVVNVGDRQYLLNNYKSFAVEMVQDAHNIIFQPLKRLSPVLTIPVATEVEEVVIKHLSLFMPVEQHTPDVIDRLMRKIRF